MMKQTIHEVNELPEQTFIGLFQDIYEHSSWIVKKVAPLRPFSSLQEFHHQTIRVIDEASNQRKLDLLQAHPNLGAKIAMTTHSINEQTGAGLTSLTAEEYEHFTNANKTYMNRFGFPFIVAVRGKTKSTIYQSLIDRLQNDKKTEFTTALAEVYKIAYFRLVDKIKTEERVTMTNQSNRQMYYGKGDVFAYRTYLKPLKGVKVIPESEFSGRNNIVFGVNVKVAIGGSQFLSSFIEGDNSLVVATDSMKNFIQRHLGSYDGSTIEGFLKYVAEAFLDKYPQMETVQLTGDEVPFEATNGMVGNTLTESKLVYKRSRNEYAQAGIKIERTVQGQQITEQYSKLKDLQLIKVEGNSFVGFVRDEYTTLPEDSNRPLFVYLNIGWTYTQPEDAIGDAPLSYVAAEQVKDIACSVFNETETPSIQNLIYLIGIRVLERFPQLKDVTFESQNHTWDAVVEDIPNSDGKVYTEPKPPFGFQVFTVTQEDVKIAVTSALEESN
ncbi:factor-independent urate hydroxylase [Priestia flexa]|uniref:Urate oxidase n=1 Tax=Priestia flexa TaxID=86664 RepID=A0ABU4J0B5_9BACI|nr:urate oxidase [Priestia flexa]MCP1189291.1 urate oxidase [Priestia flexa]MDW8514709.1 urate oxidase [Priestia flexa]MED3822505.1 urate oxidase [Priestia flexa]